MNSSNDAVSSSIDDLFVDNLNKFKQIFYHHATQAGVSEELEALTTKDITVHLIASQPLWQTIEKLDESSLMTMFNVAVLADPENVKLHKAHGYITTIMPPTDRTRAMRFIRFFLHCVKQAHFEK